MESTAARCFFTDEHRQLREIVRRFVAERLKPHVDRWEEEKTFPRDVYRQAGEAGILVLQR